MKENQLQVQQQQQRQRQQQQLQQSTQDLYQLDETKPSIPTGPMKTIIERGASWTLEETKLLLSLWGQDLVQRQATCLKRTKEVYEKISEKFNQSGFERTPDQVRTRVFNMIAEYRRILRDPNPERMKKCIFFEALHKIYQAKHMDDVKSALDDYEPENPYSPASNTILSERGDESISDSEVMDDTLINNAATSNSNSANATSINSNSNSNDAASGSTNNIATNSSTSTNSTKNNNTSATSDNIGDSINKNNDNNNVTQNNKDNVTEKDALSSNNQSSAKKIKLENPKPGTSQGQTANSSENANKQKAISQNVAGPSSSTSSSSTSNNNTTSSTNNVTGVKHQSLLLPHSTSASSSTPITKLTTSGSNSAASYININSTKLPIIRTNQFIGHSNGNDLININGTPTTTNRLPTTAAITSHQLYQAPVNTFDVTSSALLIDRMFAHLSRESENMREWIALEKERIALERTRRAQETEREVRRERVLIDTLMRFHEQWISFITRLDPRLIENASGQLPELKIPAREGQASEQGAAAPSSSSPNNSTNTSKSVAQPPKHTLFKASGGSSAPTTPQP